MSERFDLRVASIAAGGDGVGRHEGMVVFVPRTAPGDVVHVEAVREGRLMRGRVLELRTPGAARIEPPCRHFTHDRCGGCQLQHLSYEGQVAAKVSVIHDSLTRIGGLTLSVPEVEASAAQWRYRTKLTLALRMRGGNWIAGLRPFDAPGEVFPVDDCRITNDAVLAHWRDVMRHALMLPQARELRASVRLLEDGFALVVEGGRAWTTHAELFAAVPAMVELWWQPDGKRRRRVQARPGTRAGASFVQVNAQVAARVRDWVLDIVKRYAPKTAIDAYSGTGNIAAGLASLGASVTTIEIDREAALVCAGRLPAGSRSVAGPVEKLLGALLPADLVVVNPPRAGLDAAIPAMLQAKSREPKAVIYVSCNPATLARDVKRMNRYAVRSLRGFDMFPQTAHIETVCELVPAA